MKHYHESWKPTEDICVVFDDKTGEERTPEQLDAFFKDIRDAANKHDFDLSHWGSNDAIRSFWDQCINL